MKKPLDPSKTTAFGRRLTGRLILATVLFVGSPAVLVGATEFAAESPRMQQDDWYDIHVFGAVAPLAAIGTLASLAILVTVLWSSSPNLSRSCMRSARIAPFLFWVLVGGMSALTPGPPGIRLTAFVVVGAVGFFITGVIASLALKRCELWSAIQQSASASGGQPSGRDTETVE